jgi:hypothetical protein
VLACLALLAGFAAVVGPQLGAPPLERAEVYFADAALAMVGRGEIVDAKTIMLLQYGALHLFGAAPVPHSAG